MRLPVFACFALCSSVLAAAIPLPNDAGSTRSLDGQWRFKLGRNGAAEYIPLAQKNWNARCP